MNHYVLEAMDNGAAMARAVIRLIENVLVDYSHGDCRSPWAARANCAATGRLIDSQHCITGYVPGQGEPGPAAPGHGEAPAKCRGCFWLLGSGGWTRTNDLRVMSPTSCHCSTPHRWYELNKEA